MQDKNIKLSWMGSTSEVSRKKLISATIEEFQSFFVAVAQDQQFGNIHRQLEQNSSVRLNNYPNTVQNAYEHLLNMTGIMDTRHSSSQVNRVVDVSFSQKSCNSQPVMDARQEYQVVLDGEHK